MTDTPAHDAAVLDGEKVAERGGLAGAAERVLRAIDSGHYRDRTELSVAAHPAVDDLRAALLTTTEQHAEALARVEAERDRMRGALEFYAKANVVTMHPASPGHCDDGLFARKTLAALSPNTDPKGAA